MVRLADRHDAFEMVLRANLMLLLFLFWTALSACALSSLVYDVGRWLNAW